MAETAPTKRDQHLQLIGRYKRVIGDALRSRTKGRQMTEVAFTVASLNRMLELGRPDYVRLS